MSSLTYPLTFSLTSGQRETAPLVNLIDINGLYLTSSYRNMLTTALTNMGALANYQPGNYTGTLNASAWLNSIGAAPSLAQGTSLAQPIILPFSGQKYAYLSGVSGNYLGTPNAAANQITGDIDLRVYVSLPSWTPAVGAQGFISKSLNDGNAAYDFGITTSGNIVFRYTGTGAFAGLKTATSSASTGFAAGAASWVRVTYASATGKVNFSTSQDGVTYIALGTEQTITAGAIFAGTDPIRVGSAAITAITGKVYRAQIYNGINGTLAVDFNASDWPETTTNGATAVSSTTGELWTLSNTGGLLAQIVGSPQLLFDGAAMYMQMTTTLVQPETVIAVIKPITWTSTDRLWDGATTDTMRATQIVSSPNVIMVAGGAGIQLNIPLNAYAISSTLYNSSSSYSQLNAGAPVTGDVGTNNAGGFTLGARGDGLAGWGNEQVKEVIIIPSVPSAAQLAQVLILLNAIHRVY
jgi:hypothetical protein